MGKPTDRYNLSIAEQKMIKFKKQIRATAKLQIEKWIQERCQFHDLRIGDDNRKVKSMNDIKNVFVRERSLENCVNIWDVMIGQFELSGNAPFTDFENMFPQKQNWKYSTTESDEKLRSGFIEKLIRQQRREKKKLVNMAGKKAHGIALNIVRPPNMINEHNKFKKRTKGICDTSYMISNLHVEKVSLQKTFSI